MSLLFFSEDQDRNQASLGPLWVLFAVRAARDEDEPEITRT